MSEMRTWSNSALTTLQMCGHKWYLRYIKKDWRPSGYAAKRGIAAHLVAKEAHKRQMVESKRWEREAPLITELPGTKRSVEEARDIAAKTFDDEVQKGVQLSDSEKKMGEKAAREHHRSAAIDLSALYVSKVAPPIEPIAVERTVEIEARNLGIKLKGIIDLVSLDELPQDPNLPPNGDIIRDLKTKEKKPNVNEATNSQQISLYWLIRLAEHRKDPEHVKPPSAARLVHLVRTPKEHELDVVVQDTTRDQGDMQSLVRRIHTAIEAVQKGVFVPADPSIAASPCSYCEFADGTCVYVRRKGAPTDEA